MIGQIRGEKSGIFHAAEWYAHADEGGSAMDWLGSLENALDFMERGLTDEITVEDAAKSAYLSPSSFQLLFHVAMGLPAGEYLRNRRMTLAARDLLRGERILDVAMRYQYDTQDSFSKAFARFHGVPPTKITRESAKAFEKISLRVTVQGGFAMTKGDKGNFKLMNWDELSGLSAQEKYDRLCGWAGDARGHNPGAFDALTRWMLDDSQWTRESLAENERIFKDCVLSRFLKQNAQLRECLSELRPSGVVNEAVFGAIDRFTQALEGRGIGGDLQGTVDQVMADFSKMLEPVTRKRIAGDVTGPEGVDSADFFGYVNILKDLDAQVQWTLFMPGCVKRQQQGFTVESFEYKSLPAMRFVGREGDDPESIFSALDKLEQYKSDYSFDAMLTHHDGLCVDVGVWHGVWGRFLQKGAPVPEGFVGIDFSQDCGRAPGAPYAPRFAEAVFAGSEDALHQREGFDVGAMYDVTRNIILGQGVGIPYPEKYWTAEVFQDGYGKKSRTYLFSVENP